MRLISLLFAALVLAGGLIACNSKDAITGKEAITGKGKVAKASGSPAIQTAPPNDGVRRVTVSELRDAIARGEALVVDVRSEMAFKESHIKGARLVPVNEVLAKAGEMPRDKLIVTYCA